MAKTSKQEPEKTAGKSNIVKLFIPEVFTDSRANCKNYQSLDKILRFAVNCDDTQDPKTEPSLAVRGAHGYIKLIVILGAFSQWITGIKKANKGIEIKDIQKESQHKFYASKLSRDPDIQTLLSLIGALTVVEHIPKSEFPNDKTAINVANSDVESLQERKGAASKRMNPKLSREARLTYARGVILATRGAWVSAPYYKPESILKQGNILKVCGTDITAQVNELKTTLGVEDMTEETIKKLFTNEEYNFKDQTSSKVPSELSDNKYPLEILLPGLIREITDRKSVV